MITYLSDVLTQARTHLNDLEGLQWSDARLLPLFRIAFDEIQAELILNGIPIINTVSAIMTVPALSTDDLNLDLSTVTGYPIDMVVPMWLKERALGESNSDFIDMKPVSFIPNVDKDTQLLYWCWQGQTIMVRGALVSTQVQLRYQKFLPVPGTNPDAVPILLGQMYLAPRVAAQALENSGLADQSNRKQALAVANLSSIIRINVKQSQSVPTRRKPYHRRGQQVTGNFGI